jgi:hypothetical protein
MKAVQAQKRMSEIEISNPDRAEHPARHFEQAVCRRQRFTPRARQSDVPQTVFSRFEQNGSHKRNRLSLTYSLT